MLARVHPSRLEQLADLDQVERMIGIDQRSGVVGCLLFIAGVYDRSEGQRGEALCRHAKSDAELEQDKCGGEGDQDGGR